MRGRAVPVLVAVVWWVMAVGCTVAQAEGRGLGARAPTLAEQAYIDAVYQEVRSIEPNALSRERARQDAEAEERTPAASVVAARAIAVDNSTLQWFPPIGNQGYQNSCVAWASGYYYNTYVQAMDAGIDVSGGSPEHTCSPAFLYPLINGGVDDGASAGYAMARLGDVGCCSLALKPYAQADYTSWPSEEAWVEALSRRTENAYRIRAGSLEGLETVKQLLSNGGVAITGFNAYANWYYDYPRTVAGVDSDVYYCPDGRLVAGHAVTLVGYDDSKTYRDHRDGVIHQGAFLAANSWGPSWGVENSTGSGGKGFFWVAYAAFLEGNFGPAVLYTDDREDYRPIAYAAVGVAHPQRGYLNVYAGMGDPAAPDGVTYSAIRYSGGTQVAVDGSRRIAVDLTELADLIDADWPATVFVVLSVSSEAAGPGVITSAELFSGPDGEEWYASVSSSAPPVSVEVGASGYASWGLFSDVTFAHWAYDSIAACYAAGIVGGYPDGSYQPEVAVSRDQMAVYVSRALAGGDENVPDGPATPTFADVAESHWAYRYIEYATAQQIVRGYPEGNFNPSLQLDRGQMAVFLARAVADPTGDDGLADYTAPDIATFPDVGVDFWAYRYIEYLADPARAVAQGYIDGLYHPEGVCTRDQMAVYIARAFELPG